MKTKINSRIAEIVGIYIGDGHIYRNKNKFQIGFTVNPKTDVELFNKIKDLVEKEWDKKIDIKIRSNALRIVFRSK